MGNDASNVKEFVWWTDGDTIMVPEVLEVVVTGKGVVVCSKILPNK